jgi:tetratricopeptide (TPR) repeat protein
MAPKQTSSDKISGNGGNTALYIISSNGSKQAEDDLAQLAEIAFKSSNPLELYTGTGLKSNLAGNLEQDSKLRRIQDAQFPDDIKNVMPVTLPLSNDPGIIARWAPVANKAFNGNNVVVANGRLHEKAGYLTRYCGYWANFWPKLFTGSNNNLASCEAVLLPIDAFHHLVIDKKVKNAWQIAALAEKEGLANSVNFELQADDFSFGDGIKAFFSGFAKGFTAIGNSFFKTAQIRDNNTNWANINHSGYKRIFGVMATLLLALMCFISFDYNVTWDEPNHNTFSKDVLSYYTSFGEDTTMFDFQKAGHRDYFTNVFYGMSIDVFSAAINSVTGAENDFKARHFVNAIVGFLTILFTALVVRSFSGWLPAIITLLAMVCSPSFFGHCFNNPKDIPFAAGYIMTIYYLIRLLKQLPRPTHQTKVMLAIAIGFAISIRAGGLLLLGYLAMFMFLHWILNSNKKGKVLDSMKPYFMSFVVIGVAGYIIGILMWPYALRQPLTGAVKALREFEKFSYLTYYELFEGVRQFNKPWYYEPKLIMLTAPIAIVAGSLIGLLLGWFRKDKLYFMMFALLVFATLFPTSYAIYKNSYVYNGWRHFIFIYPSLVAIAVLGWYWLATLVKNSKAQLLVMGILALTFIKPGIWSIVNHPYQYIYFNEIAGGVEKANGNYELDYWNQSPRAAFAWLVKNKPEILGGDVKVSSNNIQEALKTFVPEGKDVKYAWTREYEWADNDWTYAIWTTRTLSRNQIIGGYWPPKGTIHEIKVDGVTVAAVVQSENKNNDGFMGKKYLKKNNGDSALYFYSRAYAWNPLEEEYARGIADANKLKMNFDSAIMFYKKAIALRDGNYEAYQSLGEVYYTQAMMRDQNNPDKKLIELAFDNLALAFSYKKNASAPLIMGEIRLQQNKAEEAKTYFNQFLQTYGNEGRGYLGLAKAQLQLNESDSAYMNLQYAIQLQPKNPEPYYLLGTELKKTGNVKEAEQFLNEYLKLSGMPMQQ